MAPSLEITYAGMKANLDQLQIVGEQLASLVSNNEPARNMVELIEEHRSFQANAAVVHTADEVLGSIIDLIV